MVELQSATEGGEAIEFSAAYSCTSLTRGCMDPRATNYDPAASLDDLSCTYIDPQCTAANPCGDYSCAVTHAGPHECACFTRHGAARRSAVDITGNGADGPIWAAASDPFDVVLDGLNGSCEQASSFNSTTNPARSASVEFRNAVTAASASGEGGIFVLRFSSETTFESGSENMNVFGVTAVIDGTLPPEYDTENPDYSLLPVWNGASVYANNFARCMYRRLAIQDKTSTSNSAVLRAFGGSVVIMHDVLMRNNLAMAFHGCIWCHTGVACDMVRVKIEGNAAKENAGIGGWGAIRMTNSTFEDNWALRGAAFFVNRAREGRPCVDPISDCSASGLMICQAGFCEPQALLQTVVFTNNTAFGDYGGALLVGGSGLDMKTTVQDVMLDNNAAAVGGGAIYDSAVNDPTEGRQLEVIDCEIQHSAYSNAMYLRSQNQWKLHTVTFESWRDNLVYTEGSSAGGCAAYTDSYPCGPGESCTTREDSAWCSVCEGPRQISAGRECVECSRTQIPSIDRSECLTCGAGRFGTGSTCDLCPAGRYSFGDVDNCMLCAGGQEPEAATMLVPNISAPHLGEGATACAHCRHGSYSPFGIACVTCLEPNVIQMDGSECIRCGLGMGPNTARSVCQVCIGNTFSTKGACLPCYGGTATNALHTACVDFAELEPLIEELEVVTDILVHADMLLNTTQHNGANALGQEAVLVTAQAPLSSVRSAADIEADLWVELAGFLGMAKAELDVSVVLKYVATSTAEAGFGSWGLNVAVEEGNIERNFTLVVAITDPALQLEKLDELDGIMRCANNATCATVTESAVLSSLQGFPGFRVTCPPGLYRAKDDSLCRSCPHISIPGTDYTGDYRTCVACT